MKVGGKPGNQAYHVMRKSGAFYFWIVDLRSLDSCVMTNELTFMKTTRHRGKPRDLTNLRKVAQMLLSLTHIHYHRIWASPPMFLSGEV